MRPHHPTREPNLLSDPSSLLDTVLAAIPDERRQSDWIERLVGFGVRRPGTSENAAAREWIADELHRLGLTVTRQPVPALTSHPGPAAVEAWSADDPAQRVRLEGFTMPFTTAVRARRFRLERHDRIAAGAAPGGHDVAALHHVRLTDLPIALISGAALGVHDPADEFATHVHTLPFGRALGKEIDDVVGTAGAMIGVLDAPWTTSDYFVPYDGVVRDIPGMWLDREALAPLDRLLGFGAVEVELTTDVVHRDTVDHNIVATLPGRAAEDWMVIGSHHDAPWASAVEDASGVAQVLAQAEAWAAVPSEERPLSLAFVLTAAHMSEGAGTRELLRSWPHRERIRFAVHLEHIAREAEPDGAGGLRPTDRAEVRWWFVSDPDPHRFAALADSVCDAVADEGLDRSLVLPPEIFGAMPPTDGGFYHPAGIPMVNLLAAPMYLFDPLDTVDMVHGPSLVPTARAAARIVIEAAERIGAFR